MASLGAILIDTEGKTISSISELLVAEDFYSAVHRLIYSAIMGAFDTTGGPVDLVIVRDELSKRDQLKKIGGVEYLLELAESLPSVANGMYYAKVVKECSQLRSIISTCEAASNDAYNRPDQIKEFLDGIEDQFSAIHDMLPESVTQTVPEIVPPIVEQMTDPASAVSGIPTGFADYDALVGGLHNGEVIVVAARPSMGKSALVLNILENIAADRPVALFSLEMSRKMLGERLIAGKTGKSAIFWNCGFATNFDREKVKEDAESLLSLKMVIHDSPVLTPAQLRSHGRRLSREHGLAAIAIDYLQLMHVPGFKGGDKRLEVGTISRAAKQLARELDIPVILISQLNRGPEGREGNRPKLSDLRESGDIEQDADVVLLLYRNDYYAKAKDPNHVPDNLAEVIIAKNRNGPTGLISLVWDAQRMRFGNLSTASEQPDFYS